MENTLTANVPLGTIIAFVGPDATAHQDQNWFPCTGGTLDKNLYVDLGNLLKESFGPYDGNKFYLPDLRGQFLRGVDPTGGIDPDSAGRYQQNTKKTIGPVVGSFENDCFAAHTHSNALCWGGDSVGYDGGGHNVVGSMGNGGGGSETRPKNVFVYYLIYAGKPFQ